jgi:hypothetical protein
LLEIIDDRPKAFGKRFIRRRIPNTPQAWKKRSSSWKWGVFIETWEGAPLSA